MAYSSTSGWLLVEKNKTESTENMFGAQQAQEEHSEDFNSRPGLI
jgi:hypothetical protein